MRIKIAKIEITAEFVEIMVHLLLLPASFYAFTDCEVDPRLYY